MKKQVKILLLSLAVLTALGVIIGLAVHFSAKDDSDEMEAKNTCAVPPCYCKRPLMDTANIFREPSFNHA